MGEASGRENGEGEGSPSPKCKILLPLGSDMGGRARRADGKTTIFIARIRFPLALADVDLIPFCLGRIWGGGRGWKQLLGGASRWDHSPSVTGPVRFLFVHFHSFNRFHSFSFVLQDGL